MKYANSESCGSCKFSVNPVQLPGIDSLGGSVVGGGTDLIYHRYPPIPIYNKKRIVACGWPSTGKDDWCGEYKHRGGEKA